MFVPVNYLAKALYDCSKVALLACVLSLLACSDQSDQSSLEKPSASAQITAAEISKNNRGVALMGRFEYQQASDVFAELIASRPDWHDVRINYAVALKNRQQAEDGIKALEQLNKVLAVEPGNLRANYVAGVLQLYIGEIESASGFFKAVLALDNNDAYAHYYLGQCQLRQGDAEAASRSYQNAIRLDPYLRSAYYSDAQVLRRLGRTEEATTQLSLFQRFANNPAARLAEFKYTRMGPKSLAIVAGETPESIEGITLPEGPLFADQRVVAKISTTETSNSIPSLRISTVDIDNNGAQDLFLSNNTDDTANSTSGNSSYPHLLKSDAAGKFSEVVDHPWNKTAGINAIAWGDIDNDQTVDAYLCRNGANQLWLQQEGGEWQQAPIEAGIENGDNDCADATMVDADHDGDLDILIANRGAGDELLNNNRDGTFKSLADKLHSAAEPVDSLFIVTTDLDADSDVDLIFVREQAPHQVLINDRLWDYTPSTEHKNFQNADVTALATADTNADGQIELLSLDRQGKMSHWQPNVEEKNTWEPKDIYDSKIAKEQTADLFALDLNGNGRPEVALLANGAFEILELPETSDPNGYAEILLTERFDGGMPTPVTRSLQGSSLFAVDKTGTVLEWAPGPGRFKFATLSLSGKHDAAETMRSNASGIGTQIGVRNDTRWSITDTHKNSSRRGYSLQPTAIGLGGRDKADFVEIEWSDGVYQTELDVQSDVSTTIAEEQRQLGSCPILFAWDGEKFKFVTDILGVGAQGFLIEPGVLLPPRPWEKVSFSPGTISAQNGRMKFKLTEPMEENAYVDAMSLESYDLPESWGLVVDERIGTAAPEVTGDALFYRNEISPIAASDSAGNDVLDRVLEHDQYAMHPGEIDRRFIGLLKDTESVTLKFERAINSENEAAKGQAVLVAESWLEFPYSQTHFSVWQAGLEYRPVSLAARDVDGEWHDVYPDFGFPGGMPRVMALPLLDLPENTIALRLSWNREIYWDRLRIVYSEQAPDEMRHSIMSPELARVAKSGFSRRINHAQRRPEYDYQQRKPFGDALGEMTELVNESDDALAIIGPGEEVHVEFAAPAPPPQGLKRWYVLDTRGWGKDKDMYTQTGETVGPLPRTYPDVDNVVRDALHQRHNTRFQSGR